MAETFDLDLVYRYSVADDDLDSLFGGGDEIDPASLFIEAGTIEPSPSCEPDSEPSSSLSHERLQEATNTTALLSFFDVSAHAQGNQQSAPAVPQLTFPTSPSIPQLSLPQLTLPAVPDPLDAFLSLQDGHTSGDSVVSTQHSTCSAASPSESTTRSPEEVLDDAAREAELIGLWEAAPIDEPPVNAQAENRNSDAIQDEIEISPTDMPGFRYAKSQTNSFVRLPRRIDHDLKLAQELGYYITLNRKTKVETLYGHLELSLDEGKRLSRDIKEVLKESKLIQLISKPTGTATATKKVLIRIALYLLISKDWGRTWFGESHKNAATRKYFWPRDSSILLSGFVMVLYRIYTNTKQQFLAMLRTQATMKNANSDGAASSSSSPVSSAQPATPTLIHLEEPAADGQSFFAALVKNAVASKKRKRDEAVLGLDEDDSTYPVEVPLNARLKYHVYVKDKTDGADIMPPTTYRHTDYLIARGAFSSLKAAFEAASQDPVYEIQTPSGRRKVATEAEWDAAVLAIYNARRIGGVVEVDIFV